MRFQRGGDDEQVGNLFYREAKNGFWHRCQ